MPKNEFQPEYRAPQKAKEIAKYATFIGATVLLLALAGKPLAGEFFARAGGLLLASIYVVGFLVERFNSYDQK